jgi:hypothetical protein
MRHALMHSARTRVAVVGVALVACAAAGAFIALSVAAPSAAAQVTTLPDPTTSVPIATSTAPAPDPDPAPAPAPAPPPPSPAPSTETSTVDVTESGVTPRAPKHNRKRHARPAPVGPFAHAPRDVPVYAAPSGTAETTLSLSALTTAPSGGHRIPAFLFALLGFSLIVLALAATPTQTLAGLSSHLPAHRMEVAITGISIMSGVAIGFGIALLGA